MVGESDAGIYADSGVKQGAPRSQIGDKKLNGGLCHDTGAMQRFFDGPEFLLHSIKTVIHFSFEI